ncbi:NAD-dependent epimerase/dehydratase family protein [Xanthobacteraceae bacterium A53D]
MKVVVTGSNGLLGRDVTRAIVDAGHDVVGIDVTSPAGPVPWQHITADLRDLAASLQLFRGADAVVHMAGVPRPVGLVPSEVFSTNTAINYAVAEAAVLCDVKRLVYASSFAVLGYPFFVKPVAPQKVPVDTSHPIQAQDAYGLSKWIGEEVIDAAVRRSDLTAVSLRLPWIQNVAGFLEGVGARRARAAQRPCDLWGYIDSRDAATAIVLSLTAGIDGHARFMVSAADTYMEEPTEALLDRDYPGMPRAAVFPGHASIISLEDGRRILGFEPRYSWRMYGT